MVDVQYFVVTCVAIVMAGALFYGVSVVVETDSNATETRYEVSAIDLQTLVYVNNENEIITIDWSDKTSQIKIVNANTTYIVAETTEHFTFHTLHLNVSDLECQLPLTKVGGL